MSFFHEPPPLDSDIPPPLDDKLKDNDFDLDDEEITIEDEELPELPTDFNVYSSAATDENRFYSHPPPEFQNFAVNTTPPPDIPLTADNRSDENESPEPCDVAKEKESCKIDDVVPQHQTDQIAGDDIKANDITGTTLDKETTIKHLEVQTENNNVEEEKTNDSAAVLDEVKVYIPLKLNEPLDDNLHSTQDNNEVVVNVEQHVNDKKQVINDDDDFADFAEPTPSESREESFDAFKTEDALGKSEDLETVTEIETVDDIPEPIPELTLDDDDDDFNDFETAIPINRLMEEVKNCAINEKGSEEPQEIKFEADFSSFNAFSEPSEEIKFAESSSDFKPTGLGSESQQYTQLEDDDDDDFGDFEDFTQAPAPLAHQPAHTETTAITFMNPENVNGVIDMMFPSSSALVHEKPETLESDTAREQQVIKSDNFVNKFNDFDSTVALGYIYNNSKASQSLVVALGIDTRNILLGPQWASSSSTAQSNMPRYAANLSFNPIEPMKPSSSQSSTVKPSAETKPSILQPPKAPTDSVPEAEFDWNSSGLVNPLDGPQPKPKQSHVVEPIAVQQPAAPSAHSLENESSLYVVDQEVAQVLEAETKANASHKPELSEPSVYQWSSEISSQHHLGHFSSSAASSNILVRERTIKLPETHIFTPVKGTSPVAREVISRDVSPAPDDPYFPKGPITVKEYHDVEYSLEPKKRIDSDTDFDDFQSAHPTIVKSDPPLQPLNLLEPQKVEKLSNEIKWPEPGNITQSVSSDLDFLEAPASLAPPTATVVAPKLNFILPLAPPASTVTNKKKETVFSKPIIGTSPTEHNGSAEDDDFNDFQAAPLQIQPAKKFQSNDPITLSPARLQATVGNQSNQKSSWISSMDNDEISRIEAAFPKCKTDKKVSNEDEDDWTDFVGATQPTSLPYLSSQQPPSTISSNAIGTSSKMSNGDTDDWSDFMSVPPPISRMPSAKSSGAISSQFQSKPNFSSWHQPVGKPYVNHTTSFLTNDAGNMNQQFTSSNYPYVTDKVPRHSMTITNNFNYNFNHPELYQAVGATTANTHHSQPKPNGISTILPELDFAMPKKMINLPRGGPIDPGKK